MQINVDLIYPIGSIYMTASTVSPADLFGGMWERIEGRFLCGSGTPTQNSYNGFGTIQDNYLDPNQFGLSLGLTAGEYNHKLSVQEMPSHIHRQIIWDASPFGLQGMAGGSYPRGLSVDGGTFQDYNPRTGYEGGDQYHNNMPPFLVVNIWKRIA